MGQRGLWMGNLWPNWQHHELALLANTRVSVGVPSLADEPWPPCSGCSEGSRPPEEVASFLLLIQTPCQGWVGSQVTPLESLV